MEKIKVAKRIVSLVGVYFELYDAQQEQVELANSVDSEYRAGYEAKIEEIQTTIRCQLDAIDAVMGSASAVEGAFDAYAAGGKKSLFEHLGV